MICSLVESILGTNRIASLKMAEMTRSESISLSVDVFSARSKKLDSCGQKTETRSLRRESVCQPMVQSTVYHNLLTDSKV